MHVSRLTLRDFRNYERLDVEIPDGITVVHGPVGTGKTNLLEGMYFACTGRSCRTSNERELVRFGERVTRASLSAESGGSEHRYEVALELTPKRIKSVRADGQSATSMADVDERPLVCVFLPDRLELVKGPPGSRRAHLDSFIAALWPSRRETRSAYARALAQRNMLLSRVKAGRAGRDSLASWGRELAQAGVKLMADRSEAVDELTQFFTDRAEALGLPLPATVVYRPQSQAEDVDQLELELEQGIDNDLTRGFTTRGPHRDDLRLSADGRDLRRYGSQGQQRLALLSLLLAERDALAASRNDVPLLLLDDVLSELDQQRRENLIEAVAGAGQTLISTADTASIGALDSLGPSVTRLAVRDGELAV
jgi:DNA replication and repair protein RecF